MKLGYVIIYVPNVAETLAFYEKAFGLQQQFLHDSGDYGELKTGETILAFASEQLRDSNGMTTLNNRLPKDGTTATPAGAEIAFVTDNVDVQYEAALRHGARAVKKPAAKPWGQVVAYVLDNNGFLVEICSPVQ
ncbi:MAG: VOC family protein [Hydrotalea sp.]|nr:VOC family protein [Hydrotalea sp.]